jgi:threonine dehydrogenase-like Zn-dependent dehydrogenase
MLAETLNAIRISQTRVGNYVGVIGLGAVGLSILTIVKHTFPSKVIAIDIAQDKVERALKFGADVGICSNNHSCTEAILDTTGGKGLDVIFEAVGIPTTYELVFQIIKENGILVPFGMFEAKMELPFRKAYSKQIQMRWVRGVGSYPNEHKSIVLRMMEKGLIDPKPLISSSYKLADFEKAFTSVMAGREIRVIIEL